MPGSANTISNTQGTLNCADVVVGKNGTQLQVTWSFVPSGTQLDTRNVFHFVQDKAGLSDGFEALGTWQITAAAPLFSSSRSEFRTVALQSVEASSSAGVVTLNWSGELDAHTASDAGLYHVTLDGKEVKVQAALYDKAGVTLTLGAGVLESGARLTIAWDDLQDAQGKIVNGGSTTVDVF